jgi:hypothetical protein
MRLRCSTPKDYGSHSLCDHGHHQLDLDPQNVRGPIFQSMEIG